MVKYAPRKVYIRESGGYVELSYTEFCRCRESDQTYMDKLFIPIQGCLLEVVREQYTDFYRDKERWRYLQKLDTKNRLLSLDGFTDSEGNPLDFITDEAVDIAETVVNAVMVDRLKAALSAIGNRVNQLAAKANALNFVDAPMLTEEAVKWRQFQMDIRKKYLLPKRNRDNGCL